jgi:dolichol-phosphate mannosyltransferase
VRQSDFASGSRYLCTKEVAQALAGRQINLVTRELNERLGLSITDSFCGFKRTAYPLLLQSRSGYGMPIEVGAGGVSPDAVVGAGAADLSG